MILERIENRFLAKISRIKFKIKMDRSLIFSKLFSIMLSIDKEGMTANLLNCVFLCYLMQSSCVRPNYVTISSIFTCQCLN